VEPNLKTIKNYIIVFSLSLAGFAVLYVSIMLKGIATNTLKQMDNAFYTHFLSIREKIKSDVIALESDIIIVGIDDRTLNTLGAYNPLTYRRYHIEALEHILKGKPAAVTYDILFGDPHDDPDVDRKLSQLMKQGPVFSVFFAAAQDRSNGIFNSIAYKMPADVPMDYIVENGFEQMALPVRNAITSAGLANAYPDNDGLIRKMPLFFRVEDKLYPTVSFELFIKLMKINKDQVHIKRGTVYAGKTAIPVDDHCRVYIDIDKGYHIRELSFYDVCKGRVPEAFFKNKVVFIAATASGLGDNKLVPLYGYINGVLIHANLFLNLKNGNFTYEFSKGPYFLLLFFAFLFYTYIFYFRKELSTIKRIMGYISNVGLVNKAIDALFKISFIDRTVEAIKSAYIRHYGLRLFFLLFQETRKRIEPLLFHMILIYFSLFLLFYFFNIFLNPSAFVVQLLISYVVVTEFNRIDLDQISSVSQNNPKKPV